MIEGNLQSDRVLLSRICFTQITFSTLYTTAIIFIRRFTRKLLPTFSPSDIFVHLTRRRSPVKWIFQQLKKKTRKFIYTNLTANEHIVLFSCVGPTIAGRWMFSRFDNWKSYSRRPWTCLNTFSINCHFRSPVNYKM